MFFFLFIVLLSCTRVPQRNKFCSLVNQVCVSNYKQQQQTNITTTLNNTINTTNKYNDWVITNHAIQLITLLFNILFSCCFSVCYCISNLTMRNRVLRHMSKYKQIIKVHLWGYAIVAVCVAVCVLLYVSLDALLNTMLW